MIAYRDIVQQWIMPLGQALQLPVISVDALQPDSSLPLIAYDVASPYIDCTPNQSEHQGAVDKVVEMEWLLLIRAGDRMEMVERCRDMLGWLWTDGVDCLESIPAAMVHISPAQWKTEPHAGLGLQVKLRMKDRFERTVPSVATIQLNPMKSKE
ncbi:MULTISPECIES: hypothetical protein [unclassified Paenibacillus]|uniref:hypothetical protein n=1 Tax=unclassified Paenibacillus TaxID=185978 RepID=UPI000314C746|nr:MULTISPECIES: hypothetical protein [unclassified Paenibacillus]MCM3338220.1 hypothetical protein [Paenibacillus sp. MER TA 81-3]